MGPVPFSPGPSRLTSLEVTVHADRQAGYSRMKGERNVRRFARRQENTIKEQSDF